MSKLTKLVMAILFLTLIIVIILVFFKPKQSINSRQQYVNQGLHWQFDETSRTWKSDITPQTCPDPVIESPVNLDLVSGIIYPGQYRGDDYKPHGGFGFDTLSDNSVDVYAPMDAYLFKAARHMESGETQYSLYFINSCGFMYKLDHLRELTQEFNDIIADIPMGAEGDSRTSQISPAVFVEKGEHVATKVGFESDKNVFVDFGLYDLRNMNDISTNADWSQAHKGEEEYSFNGVCFFDYLSPVQRDKVRSLPVRGIEGKRSDYCK